MSAVAQTFEQFVESLPEKVRKRFVEEEIDDQNIRELRDEELKELGLKMGNIGSLRRILASGNSNNALPQKDSTSAAKAAPSVEPIPVAKDPPPSVQEKLPLIESADQTIVRKFRESLQVLLDERMKLVPSLSALIKFHFKRMQATDSDIEAEMIKSPWDLGFVNMCMRNEEIAATMFPHAREQVSLKIAISKSVAFANFERHTSPENAEKLRIAGGVDGMRESILGCICFLPQSSAAIVRALHQVAPNRLFKLNYHLPAVNGALNVLIHRGDKAAIKQLFNAHWDVFLDLSDHHGHLSGFSTVSLASSRDKIMPSEPPFYVHSANLGSDTSRHEALCKLFFRQLFQKNESIAGVPPVRILAMCNIDELQGSELQLFRALFALLDELKPLTIACIVSRTTHALIPPGAMHVTSSFDEVQQEFEVWHSVPTSLEGFVKLVTYESISRSYEHCTINRDSSSNLDDIHKFLLMEQPLSWSIIKDGSVTPRSCVALLKQEIVRAYRDEESHHRASKKPFYWISRSEELCGATTVIRQLVFQLLDPIHRTFDRCLIVASCTQLPVGLIEFVNKFIEDCRSDSSCLIVFDGVCDWRIFHEIKKVVNGMVICVDPVRERSGGPWKQIAMGTAITHQLDPRECEDATALLRRFETRFVELVSTQSDPVAPVRAQTYLTGITMFLEGTKAIRERLAKVVESSSMATGPQKLAWTIVKVIALLQATGNEPAVVLVDGSRFFEDKALASLPIASHLVYSTATMRPYVAFRSRRVAELVSELTDIKNFTALKMFYSPFDHTKKTVLHCLKEQLFGALYTKQAYEMGVSRHPPLIQELLAASSVSLEDAKAACVALYRAAHEEFNSWDSVRCLTQYTTKFHFGTASVYPSTSDCSVALDDFRHYTNAKAPEAKYFLWHGVLLSRKFLSQTWASPVTSEAIATYSEALTFFGNGRSMIMSQWPNVVFGAYLFSEIRMHLRLAATVKNRGVKLPELQWTQNGAIFECSCTKGIISARANFTTNALQWSDLGVVNSVVGSCPKKGKMPAFELAGYIVAPEKALSDVEILNLVISRSHIERIKNCVSQCLLYGSRVVRQLKALQEDHTTLTHDCFRTFVGDIVLAAEKVMSASGTSEDLALHLYYLWDVFQDNGYKWPQKLLRFDKLGQKCFGLCVEVRISKAVGVLCVQFGLFFASDDQLDTLQSLLCSTVGPLSIDSLEARWVLGWCRCLQDPTPLSLTARQKFTEKR